MKTLLSGSCNGFQEVVNGSIVWTGQESSNSFRDGFLDHLLQIIKVTSRLITSSIRIVVNVTQSDGSSSLVKWQCAVLLIRVDYVYIFDARVVSWQSRAFDLKEKTKNNFLCKKLTNKKSVTSIQSLVNGKRFYIRSMGIQSCYPSKSRDWSSNHVGYTRAWKNAYCVRLREDAIVNHLHR